MHIRVVLDTARASVKQPHTEASRSSDVSPIEELPRLPPDDQALLRMLSERVREGEFFTPEGQDPKENAFHEAVSELNDYILALRAKLDVGFKEPDHSDTNNAWAKAEPTRPSVKRVQNLAYNFLGLPGIKRISIGIHVQKLVAALPHFSGQIACSIPPTSTLSAHLSEVTTLMAKSLVMSLDSANLERYLTLGTIMGYRTAGMRWPVEPALKHFAGQGVETFVQQLERVIRGALDDGVDPVERVRTELLDKEGTVYRLMRVSFDRVNEAVKDIQGKSIEDARRILAEKDYSTGACPGIFPIDSVVDAEAGGKRPIAYEYAIMILRHMPPRLLQPA